MGIDIIENFVNELHKVYKKLKWERTSVNTDYICYTTYFIDGIEIRIKRKIIDKNKVYSLRLNDYEFINSSHEKLICEIFEGIEKDGVNILISKTETNIKNLLEQFKTL